ncbi:MAG: nitroreductase [Oscillospiraceae bacterium]|nr:nitroreductase [Oscillospiraceae bacterium]
MNVTEAVISRRSIRAFTPDAVSKELLMEIFEAAVRTPSWANSQPWDVFVASGETLDRIRTAYVENYKNAVPPTAEIERPIEWPEAAKKRTQGLGPDMQRDCGDAASQFMVLNQNMFYAPTVIFLCLDKLYAHWGLYDLGAYAQSVVLLAQERGLSTIPAITAVAYPDVLRRELNIPDNLNVAIGIPIGYVDESNKINNFNSGRSPLSETVFFFD